MLTIYKYSRPEAPEDLSQEDLSPNQNNTGAQNQPRPYRTEPAADPPSPPNPQPQQYTYGSFPDVERESQLPSPRQQDLWPFFFALVVLGCFLIFLVIPLVANP